MPNSFNNLGVLPKRIADGVVRIAGGSINAGATVTIGFAGSGAGVVLPGSVPHWTAYEDVTLQDAVEVCITPMSDVSNFAIPLRLENDAAAAASPALDIYVKFHR
jgi:hypothetical protein